MLVRIMEQALWLQSEGTRLLCCKRHVRMCSSSRCMSTAADVRVRGPMHIGQGPAWSKMVNASQRSVQQRHSGQQTLTGQSWSMPVKMWSTAQHLLLNLVHHVQAFNHLRCSGMYVSSRCCRCRILCGAAVAAVYRSTSRHLCRDQLNLLWLAQSRWELCCWPNTLTPSRAKVVPQGRAGPAKGLRAE